MSHTTWSLGFHLRSPKSWLNDPNGMCQFRGRYHFFYQYNHAWPQDNQKAWGLFTSPDLVRWRYEGVSIEPSIPEDRHGVYSGCTVVERGKAADGGDRLRAYYTGNVICPNKTHNPRDVAFANDGREANEITCTSDDGIHFVKSRRIVSLPMSLCSVLRTVVRSAVSSASACSAVTVFNAAASFPRRSTSCG